MLPHAIITLVRIWLEESTTRANVRPSISRRKTGFEATSIIDGLLMPQLVALGPRAGHAPA
eukprot:scaffold151163_cov33-Tisochrysis_lutea.AAC.6